MNAEGENKIENDVTDFSTETKTSQFTKSEELQSREINLVNVFVKEEYIENEERYICDAHERNDMLQVGKMLI
ncbi:hypothetical protein Anas_10395 [Armadillidium nasatum]|uniref:Uncharacterized protein n=1 Tax=Armadillidium nasatum TaxID=96803 RepID=A0A5N5TC04_9CRUS|nr:hypothetical protein Anas_10395 [Armadillidium nasatum]